MPPKLHTYTVVPSLPERLQSLRELAYNLRWAWDVPTRQLFRDMDDALWESTGHNPAKMLGLVAQERLTHLAEDAAFLRRLDATYDAFRAYMDGETWWSRNYGGDFPIEPGLPYSDFKIGYFSAEFGITECLPIYSGGLGILAGDHLKSASDLGLPLVGVGFLYQSGYFRQSLNADGWQQENYPQTDFYSLPIEPVLGEDGQTRTIGVDFPGRVVTAQLWKAQVGRISLYLLDTNLMANNDADRHIAGNLYGGDSETRIQQEIVLGIGGLQALQAVGITPTVCHMNEGHSAFLSLERIRRLIREQGLSFSEALEAAAAGNLFTTHTPVPAGFDVFPPDLVRRYFDGFAGTVNLSIDELLGRGRVNLNDGGEKFNMAVLAFRHARYINGVSELHGKVSRQMVQPSVPGFPLDEVPVGYVTNGIHTPSFLSTEMTQLLERTMGELSAENMASPDYWAKIDTIPDATLWAVREQRRARMVSWAREYVVGRLTRRGAGEREVSQSREILDPGILTIGFARRFATYKRGDLLLHDVERLKRILNNADRPVQFVFAGKAHPKDDAGKELIRHIVHFARGEDVCRRVVFLEDYDMAMARYLVEGVDVWLNNPRRPMEASGTSGMKVIANGGLNFSVLDGWWAEGYDASVGWEIGRGEDYDDHGYQDYVESQDIYDTLEREIVPLFYDRNAEGVKDGLPHAWIAKIKASMKALAPVYTTARMVREYAEKYYVPAAHRARLLAEDDFARARSLVVWKQTLRDNWHEVGVVGVTTERDKLAAGQGATVEATVRLGTAITPGDVAVELYTGPVDTNRNLIETHTLPLASVKPAANNDGSAGEPGVFVYSGLLPTDRSGQQGFTVRVVPSNPDAVLPQELPLITWEM